MFKYTFDLLRSVKELKWFTVSKKVQLTPFTTFNFLEMSGILWEVRPSLEHILLDVWMLS